MPEEDTLVEEAYWKVTREGAVVARKLKGDRTRYQVLVRDRGRRKFFINQWFGTEEEARDFLNKLQQEVRELESTP